MERVLYNAVAKEEEEGEEEEECVCSRFSLRSVTFRVWWVLVSESEGVESGNDRDRRPRT